MARGSQDWNAGPSVDLRDPEVAREFLLAALREGMPIQVALGKVVRALGLTEFAKHVHMTTPSVQRTIGRRHAPPIATANRLLAPFELQLAIAPIDRAESAAQDLIAARIRRVASRVVLREAAARSKRSVTYALYGQGPKVSRLLESMVPRTRHHTWRKGDPGASGPRMSSGVRVDLGDFADTKALVRSVDTFLRRDADFLRNAATCTGSRVWSVLSILQFVYPFVPTGVSLPPRTLSMLGELGIEISCTGYPCED